MSNKIAHLWLSTHASVLSAAWTPRTSSGLDQSPQIIIHRDGDLVQNIPELARKRKPEAPERGKWFSTYDRLLSMAAVILHLLVPVFGTPFGGQIEDVPKRFERADVAGVLAWVGRLVEQLRTPGVADLTVCFAMED